MSKVPQLGESAGVRYHVRCLHVEEISQKRRLVLSTIFTTSPLVPQWCIWIVVPLWKLGAKRWSTWHREIPRLESYAYLISMRKCLYMYEERAYVVKTEKILCQGRKRKHVADDKWVCVKCAVPRAMYLYYITISGNDFNMVQDSPLSPKCSNRRHIHRRNDRFRLILR